MKKHSNLKFLPKSIRESKGLNRSTKRLLNYFLSFQNEWETPNTFYRPNSTIIEESGLSKTTFQAARNELVGYKILTYYSFGVKGQSTRYTFNSLRLAQWEEEKAKDADTQKRKASSLRRTTAERRKTEALVDVITNKFEGNPEVDAQIKQLSALCDQLNERADNAEREASAAKMRIKELEARLEREVERCKKLDIKYDDLDTEYCYMVYDRNRLQKELDGMKKEREAFRRKAFAEASKAMTQVLIALHSNDIEPKTEPFVENNFQSTPPYMPAPPTSQSVADRAYQKR